HVESVQARLPVEALATNAAPTDPTKDFFPFGLQPAFGDTLYIASSEAFSKTGVKVTFQIALTNPETGGAQTPIKPVGAHLTKLRWEIWDSVRWVFLGNSEAGRENHHAETGFSDTTRAFTESGKVTFRIPETMGATKIAGVSSLWVRVRMIDGDYGRAAHY